MTRLAFWFLLGVLFVAACGRPMPYEPPTVEWCVKHAFRVDTVWSPDGKVATVVYQR